MNAIVTFALRNPQTSIPALVYGLVSLLEQLFEIWWPDHFNQIDASAKAVKGFCIVYLGLNTRDAISSAKALADVQARLDTHDQLLNTDTNHINKPTDPPKP